MNKCKGIITADVVGSTKLPNERRDLLPNTLRKLVDELHVISPMRLEIYRGDSFQIIVGKYIGYLERILIVTFVLSGSVEGIGFLLAAKSVFRFGDLQKSEDVRNTEYVLIGTFLSFFIAIVIGLGASMLLRQFYTIHYE